MRIKDVQRRKALTNPKSFEPIFYLIGLPIISHLVVGAFIYAVFALISAFAMPHEVLIVSNGDLQ